MFFFKLNKHILCFVGMWLKERALAIDRRLNSFQCMSMSIFDKILPTLYKQICFVFNAISKWIVWMQYSTVLGSFCFLMLTYFFMSSCQQLWSFFYCILLMKAYFRKYIVYKYKLNNKCFFFLLYLFYLLYLFFLYNYLFWNCSNIKKF